MKKLSKKQFEEFLRKLPIDKEGQLPFFENCKSFFNETIHEDDYTLSDYLAFIKLKVSGYREFYKYGEIDLATHIRTADPALKSEAGDEEQSLPVLDANEVAARSVCKFVKYLREKFSEDSTLEREEIIDEIHNFISTLDNEEADNED